MSDSWHIAGRGAIGLLWAEQLHRQSLSVELIIRDTLSHQCQQNIRYSDINDNHAAFNVTLTTSKQVSQIDKLIVPLKAYDVLPALQQLKSKITPSTLVILCHNGMGTIEQVQQLLGHQQPLLFATTTHGAMRNEPYQVTHTGFGETKMGWCSEPITPLPAALNHILAPVTWHQNIEAILWQKLAVNGVINPLTAIHQCPNGQLLAPKYHQKIAALSEEIGAVAQACGIALSANQVLHNSKTVMQATAKNYSSMNRDVCQNRMTEIDFITGYIIKKARSAGIKTPENQALYEQIKQL